MVNNQSYDIGMIGLGVMGHNLLLNMAHHGYKGIGYDKDHNKVQKLRQEAKDSAVQYTSNIQELISLLKRPRAIMLLVPAGAAVDSVIQDLLPFLEVNDLIIDAGNSYFKDSNNRSENLAEKGIQFLGVGIDEPR